VTHSPHVVAWRDAHVIVTGGSSGIGRAFCRQVGTRGASVSVLAMDDADLAATRSELETLGITTLTLPVDVTDADAVRRAVGLAEAAFGPVEVLLTSAGVAHPGYFEQLDESVFRWMMEVDYFGTLYAMRAVVPPMMARGHGSVVGISSTAGLVGVFGYSAYGPAKFAVRGLLEVLRMELRPYGIHVGCVCPPDTDTPQLAYENRFKPDETRAISGVIHPYSADRVAASIVAGIERGAFLISPDWQTRVLARAAGLARGAWFRFCDARVARVRRDRLRTPAAATDVEQAPQPTRPTR
jgi:3-dehydrosphinganine reductase